MDTTELKGGGGEWAEADCIINCNIIKITILYLQKYLRQEQEGLTQD